MRLVDLYLNKLCPRQPRHMCDGSMCAKFVSCMVEEIDALYVISGNKEAVEEFDKELIKAVAKHDESLL